MKIKFKPLATLVQMKEVSQQKLLVKLECHYSDFASHIKNIDAVCKDNQGFLKSMALAGALNPDDGRMVELTFILYTDSKVATKAFAESLSKAGLKFSNLKTSWMQD